MPERSPSRKSDVLVIDVRRVLDTCAAGRAAAAALEARFRAAQAQRASMKDGVEAARFEIDTARAIEGERARLRDELLAKVRPLADAVRKERGALAVVDAAVALAFDASLDVTSEVVRRLDE